MAQPPAKPRQSVELRYLWDSQTIIAVDGQGQVLASEPLARLIVQAPRRKALHPGPRVYGYEIDAVRNAVIAEAQLAGTPAPEGWVHRLHGKAIHTSKERPPMRGIGVGRDRELPEAGPLEAVPDVDEELRRLAGGRKVPPCASREEPDRG